LNALDHELVRRIVEKIDATDEKARDLMADGLLQNFGEYRHAGGYRKGLRDAKTLINETFEELMKE
jgi:hypothetical protein